MVYLDDLKRKEDGKFYSRLTADTVAELLKFGKGLKLKGFRPAPCYSNDPRMRAYGWSGEKMIGTVDHYEVEESLRKKILKAGAIQVRYGNEPWRDKMNKKWDLMNEAKYNSLWKQFDTSNPGKRRKAK